MSVIYLQLLSIPYHIGRNAGCRNAGQTIAQNISLINSTDLCQKALAFSTQCHTIERRTNEKKTGRIKLTGRFFVRQRTFLSGHRRRVLQEDFEDPAPCGDVQGLSLIHIFFHPFSSFVLISLYFVTNFRRKLMACLCISVIPIIQEWRTFDFPNSAFFAGAKLTSP